MAKKKEEPMTAVAESKNYNDLFKKIDGLSGLAKSQFTRTLSKDEKKAYIQHLKERDLEMVTGVFRSFEPVGGTLSMTGKAHENEDPVKYDFVDGQTYTIPRYLAKRFENEFQGSGTWYPTHSHIMDMNGKPITGIGKKNRRFGFSSLDFQ